MIGYNFSEGVRRTLQRSRNEAGRLHHDFVSSEHILLALLQDHDTIALLGDLGIKPESLQSELTQSLKPGSAQPGVDFPYTAQAKRVLEYSMQQAQELNHSYIGTEHLLLGILRAGKTPAADLLDKAGIKLTAVQAAVLRRSPAPERPKSLLGRIASVLERPSKTGGYNFTHRVRKILQLARQEAARWHHEYVGTEHILLGLAREGDGVAAAVLTNFKVDFEEILEKVDETLRPGVLEAPQPDIPYTARAKKVLEFAMSEARELNHSYVGSEHLLLGLLREAKGIAAQVLNDAGITLESARAEVLRLVGSEAVPPETVSHDAGRRVPVRRVNAAFDESSLDQAFKSAVALIELHQRRFGAYPESLENLQFVGDLERVLLKGLRYEKLADGYALEMDIGQGVKPGLTYPPEFWHGLGIRRTNVDGFKKRD